MHNPTPARFRFAPRCERRRRPRRELGTGELGGTEEAASEDAFVDDEDVTR
jgi:hypothetical protein